MLWWLILAVVLALWVLGWFVANLGTVVHVLLVAALAILIVRLVQGRRVA